MNKISLGRHRLKVSAMGLGCCGMTDEREAVSVIHRSLELGVNFLDISDRNGLFENEQLTGRAIKGQRDQFVLSAHFGYEVNNRAGKGYVAKAVERSLKNLGTDYIDLLFCARPDPHIPVEETVQAMARLVREGKIGYIGLSDVSSSIIFQAQKIHPVAAVQVEYSPFERTVEKTGLLNTLKQLGIGLIAYSPVKGKLLPANTGIKETDEASENIFLLYDDPDETNMLFKSEMKISAEELNISISQLIIAWIITKGGIPVPVCKTVGALEQNIAASNIHLSSAVMNRIETSLALAPCSAD